MFQDSLLKNKIFNWIYFILFLALAFFLPLKKEFVVYIIGFIFLFWLIEKPWLVILGGIYLWLIWSTQSVLIFVLGLISIIALSELVVWVFKLEKYSHFLELKKEPFRWYILAFAGFYLLYILGLIYSSNLEYAAFDLEVKFSLFVFPVVIATIRKEVFQGSRVNILLIVFILGCLVSTLISFGLAVDRYTHVWFSTKLFYYFRLSHLHHPGYMAMFLTFAIAVLICFMVKKSKYKLDKWNMISFSGLIIYLSIFVILLSSKAGIISLVLVFLFAIGYYIINEKKILQGLILTVLTGLLFYLLLVIFPYSVNRMIKYQSAVKNTVSEKQNENQKTDSRIEIWTASIHLIKNNFLIGVGTGDVKDKLLETYEDEGKEEALFREYNTHNQYLQTFIALGIIGFLTLVLSLLLPAYYAFRKKVFLYFMFLMIIAVNFLIESMFETQDGVVFYAFFNAFLFYVAKRELIS